MKAVRIEHGSGLADIEAAARELNVAIDVVDMRSLNDIEGPFAAMTGKRVGAVILLVGAAMKAVSGSRIWR